VAIGKPRGKNGNRPVYVYDPRAGRKVYVGSREKLRGRGGAQELERQKAAEFAGHVRVDGGAMTIGTYAAIWLELHHGEHTRRPARATRDNNVANLRPFLAAYGDRPIDGGIERRDALAWAKKHPHNAKVVSAMFNDAFDDQKAAGSPFANRRQEQPRGRKDIKPITEQEVELSRRSRTRCGARRSTAVSPPRSSSSGPESAAGRGDVRGRARRPGLRRRRCDRPAGEAAQRSARALLPSTWSCFRARRSSASARSPTCRRSGRSSAPSPAGGSRRFAPLRLGPGPQGVRARAHAGPAVPSCSTAARTWTSTSCDTSAGR
jgi:hypothetical protein